MNTTTFQDLEICDYNDAWQQQEKLFDEVVNAKLHNRNNPDTPKRVKHHLLFVEHPHVYTLGKSGTPHNLLINSQFLESIGASFYKIDRGGDITYHGPGQIVGYPIFDLEDMNLQLKNYINKLEEVIIKALDEIGIKGERLEGATGVWIDTGKPDKTRKICAIGVKAGRHVSMHGFALNVNTDLTYFNHINPCGFVNKGVTSIEKELGIKQNIEEIKERLLNNMVEMFNLTISK